MIRPRRPADDAAIRLVNELAFKHAKHDGLIAALRRNGRVVAELVAEVDGEVVGHALFSPLTITSAGRSHEMIALGPIAVLPGHQGKGIGGELVRAGVDECKRLGYGAVFLVGHTTYYPRFGFLPARPFGIIYDDGRDSFQVLVLQEGALDEITGTAHFAPEFDEV